MNCHICTRPSKPFGSAILLSKYNVSYFRCEACGFIQTESPYWLSEAYSEALSTLDVGVMQRNIYNAAITTSVISLMFPKCARFLDYGGGHGTLVRMLRDRGFEFFWSDQYARNLHSRGFEHHEGERYEFATAYEVLEHLPDPKKDMSRIFELSDNLLASTLTLPNPAPQPPNWWYYAVNGGQHISLYTLQSLQQIASHFNRHLLSHGPFHLFTKHTLSQKRFRIAVSGKLAKIINAIYKRPSLTLRDLEAISRIS